MALKQKNENEQMDPITNSFFPSTLPVPSSLEESHSIHFSNLQGLINNRNFPDAITMLLSLFPSVSSEKEVIQCYQFLFHLLPHFTSLGLLENNLPHLLLRSSFLPQYQQELAVQLGTYYRDHSCYQDAMHAFAKAMQISNDKQVHRVASQIFVQIFQQRLEQFLANSMPSAETLQSSLKQIQAFKTFCLNKKDLQPFYTKAIARINNIPFERQEAVAACRMEILQLQTEIFQEPLILSTERYRDALQALRKAFSFSLVDVRAFQRHVTQKFKEMFKVFLDDIFILLGPPPCSYDIRAMGSLGREEICPYSDLEFLILIEDAKHKPYFKRLVEILEIQIASLGETQRFPFFFTCLSQPNPSGLHVDNSPTQEERLIGTPANLVSLQQDEMIGPQEIAYTSLKTCSLAQSGPDLYLQFRQELKKEPSLQKRASASFPIRQKDYQERWKKPFNPQIDILHIKQQYVELLNHLLSDIALYFGISETNTFDIIDALIKQECFVQESGELLKEAVASIYSIRIRLHLHYRQQKEEASCIPNFQLLSLLPNEIFLLEKTYWLVLLPLYSCLDSVLKNSIDFKNSFQNIDLIQIPFQDSFFDLSESLIKQIALHHCHTKALVETHLYYFQALSKLQKEFLRKCYLKTIEECLGEESDIFKILLEIPNQSGLRLGFRRNIENLELGLHTITDKFQGGGETVAITTTSSSIPRYLKPSLIEKILEGTNIRKMYKDGAHRVCRLEYQKYDFHFKQKPSHPLMEYAVHNLTSRIAGKMTPANLLIRFDVQTSSEKKSYPVLISQTISGKNLKTAWQEVKSNANYTWTLLCAILTRPGDGRLSNYILDHEQNLQCVDNDISFVEPVVKEMFSRSVYFCSSPFCVLPLNTPLDPLVLEQFCLLDSHAILDAWIEDIIQKEKEYTQLFTEEERKILYQEDLLNSFTPTILFREGTLATLYLQFWQLQNRIGLSLENNTILTAGDLLQLLISLREENIGPYIHKSYNNTQPTPEKKLQKATSKSQEQSMTSIQYQQACLGKIPTLQEIEKTRLYSPENAKKEFLFALLQRSSNYASLKSNSQGTTLQANFQDLKNDLPRQRLVLQALIQQVKTMQPCSVIIHHSNVLQAEHLQVLLHSALTHLDLRYCSSIDDNALSLIHTSCPQLEELLLSGTNIAAFRGGVFSRILEFLQLKTLKLDRCPKLYTVQIRAPKLQIFTAKHNPKLQVLQLKTMPTFQVDCTDSPKAQITHLPMECVRTLKSGDSVYALVQLADGTLASGSWDGTINLWDPMTGACKQTLKGHTGWVSALVQLGDGSLASGSYDKTIKLWDPMTGDCKQTLEGYPQSGHALVKLADGTLACASGDNTIKQWDPTTGACKQTLEGHTCSVNALVLLADGTLASASEDNTIKLWDLMIGTCKQTLQGHTSSVNALVQLADGSLASGSEDNTIKLWDLMTGTCKQTLQGHAYSVRALVQFADGSLASGSWDNTIKLWDPMTGACEQTLQGHTRLVFALVQLADGTLASGSRDKTIKLWQ